MSDANGCVGTDTINIDAKDWLIGLYFPTGFSPDNDRVNETFKPVVRGEVEEYELNVYNRWGQLVFSTKDPFRGWNGTIGGRPQDIGNYVWLTAI